MTSCCPPRPMQWNVVTGAIARCKSKSTGYARKRKSVRAWRWTCGVKPTPKAVNKPWQHCIVHGLDKPGVLTTDSKARIICDVRMEFLHGFEEFPRRALATGRDSDFEVPRDRLDDLQGLVHITMPEKPFETFQFLGDRGAHLV